MNSKNLLLFNAGDIIGLYMGQYNDRKNSDCYDGIYQVKDINPKVGNKQQVEKLYMGMHFINDLYYQKRNKKNYRGINAKIQTDYLVVATTEILPDYEIYVTYGNILSK